MRTSHTRRQLIGDLGRLTANKFAIVFILSQFKALEVYNFEALRLKPVFFFLIDEFHVWSCHGYGMDA